MKMGEWTKEEEETWMTAESERNKMKDKRN